MKATIVKYCLGAALLTFIAGDAMAQRTPRRKTPGNNPTNPTQQGTENQTNNNNTQPPVVVAPNIPFVYDTLTGNGAIMPSLRPDNAYDKGSLTARKPLPYEYLRWDDALYAEKVWRELDLREKMNQTFRYDAQENNQSQVFVDILLRAIEKDSITAFSDDRFSQPMTQQELALNTAGGYDTAEQKDINDLTITKAYIITKKVFDSKSVVKLRIKEEWVFDRESSRMFCRILGIAPVMNVLNDNGSVRGQKVMFWLYYPDIRKTLARYEVYNPKNMGQSRMTWEELFESRMFSSYILKSTIDNAANKTIKQYIKDPILALLEGDNIKEKIFNFEQDLWSY